MIAALFPTNHAKLINQTDEQTTVHGLTHTFDANLGNAYPGRRIAIIVGLVGKNSAAVPTSVLAQNIEIAGVEASDADCSFAHGGAGTTLLASSFARVVEVATGSVGEIFFTTNFETIAHVVVLNLSFPSRTSHDGEETFGNSTDNLLVNLDIPERGIIIGAAVKAANSSLSFVNMTKRGEATLKSSTHTMAWGWDYRQPASTISVAVNSTGLANMVLGASSSKMY